MFGKKNGKLFKQSNLVSPPKVQAMKYFRLAADQGHPHAAYNLAIGHLQGIETDVMPGEAHHLIRSDCPTRNKESNE